MNEETSKIHCLFGYHLALDPEATESDSYILLADKDPLHLEKWCPLAISTQMLLHMLDVGCFDGANEWARGAFFSAAWR